MSRPVSPHPEIKDAGIYHGDRVFDRTTGFRGTVVALSPDAPMVWVHFDHHKNRKGRSAKHLDEIRLI